MKSWIVFGALGGLLCILLVRLASRRGGWQAERRGWAITLACVALLYVPFAALRGTTGDLAIELAGAAAYLTASRLGSARNAWWLVLGWLLHPLWDLFLHTHHAPAFLAPVCLGWDPIVAAYLTYRVVQQSRVGGDPGR